MTEPNVFYFVAQQEVQFLTRCPSSHKWWKELFFFVHPSFPFDFPTEWLYALPPLSSLNHHREREDYKSIISLLGGQVCHLGWLLHKKTLARTCFSLSPPNPFVSLGRFHYPFLISLSLDHILTWNVCRVYHYVFHHVGTNKEMEASNQEGCCPSWVNLHCRLLPTSKLLP